MSDISDDDKKLFRNAMRDVQPLKQAQKESVLPKQKPPKRPILSTNGPEPNENEQDNPIELSYDHMESHIPQRQFNRGGIQHKQMKRLQQGKLPIEAEIDLHRLTLKEAEQAVRKFINQSQAYGYRCVRIIHGRGHHSKRNSITLLHMVRYLLTQLSPVLAYAAAPPPMGGDGAVLVLIKRGSYD